VALVPENLSPTIALTLSRQGFDVVNVRDRGLLQATDVDVFARALQEDRILVTSDVDDFAKLAWAAKVHAGLIFFETPVCCAPINFASLAKRWTSSRPSTQLVATW